MLVATILSAWLQYAADGPHARAIVDSGTCPTATLDGRATTMTQRSGAVAGFPNVVCDVPVPVHTGSVRVGDRALPAPVTEPPKTIVVFGDTGCRLKGAQVQACNDPAQWPFPVNARTIAALHPDLVIHIGDYYYRESPCPPSGVACTGSPVGDNAASWDADWFAPGAQLFSSVPLVLARGNHEDCQRGGIGWFRYLDPFSGTSCADTTQPYSVDLPGLRLVLFDSAAGDDAKVDPKIADGYKYAFNVARGLAQGESWFVTHRPPYTNATERAAIGESLTPFELVLSGHIHLIGVFDVAGHPPLVVNGEGGDMLDSDIVPFLPAAFGSLHVTSSPYVALKFGFGVYTRTANGWSISFRDPQGNELKRCALTQGALGC